MGIPRQDMNRLALTIDEQPYLPAHGMGKSRQFVGQIGRKRFMHRPAALGEALQRFDMVSFQPLRASFNNSYDSALYLI